MENRTPLESKSAAPAPTGPDVEADVRRNGLAPAGAGGVAVSQPETASPSQRRLASVRPEGPWDPKPALAFFCYEDPQSEVGRYVGQAALALAGRQTPVHLFCRKAFDLKHPSLTLHAVGPDEEGEGLLASVQEFTGRVCQAFLRQFPAPSTPVALFAQEWSTVPAVCQLRDQQARDVMLSLHSLERQRSDMSSELSKQIEQIEHRGLREAQTVLIHTPGVGEIARFWVPECATRLTYARQPFPVEKFELDLDPGAIKGRYQIGPIDPTILFMGDLDENHGPDVLMKSVPAVLRNHKQARFVFVGDGSLLWPLRVYARYLLIEHAVRLVGHVEGQALYELVRAADVVVVPSRQHTEWWPFQAAWAASRPVVASHPMSGTLLEHEKDCVLVYPHESSVVWGIERVLFDPTLGQTISRNGRLKLEERFGWNSVAAQVEELLGIKKPAAAPRYGLVELPRPTQS